MSVIRDGAYAESGLDIEALSGVLTADDGYPEEQEIIRYVEVPVIEEVVRYVPKHEIVEIEKRVPKIETVIIEKIVEVPEIRVVEGTVEVAETVEVIKHVPKKEVIEVKKEVIKYDKVIKTNIIEKIVEVDGEIITVPKPFEVENKIIVPNYIDKKVPCVLSQKIEPLVRESDQTQEVVLKEYEPYIVPVDVYIPKPVVRDITRRMAVKEVHMGVGMYSDPAQYNYFVEVLNPEIKVPADLPYKLKQDGSYTVTAPMLPENWQELSNYVGLPNDFPEDFMRERDNSTIKLNQSVFKRELDASLARDGSVSRIDQAVNSSRPLQSMRAEDLPANVRRAERVSTQSSTLAEFSNASEAFPRTPPPPRVSGAQETPDGHKITPSRVPTESSDHRSNVSDLDNTSGRGDKRSRRHDDRDRHRQSKDKDRTRDRGERGDRGDRDRRSRRHEDTRGGERHAERNSSRKEHHRSTRSSRREEYPVS